MAANCRGFAPASAEPVSTDIIPRTPTHIRKHGCYPPPLPKLPEAVANLPKPGRPKGSYEPPRVGFHKGSGQARCRVNGNTVYLGRYGTPESEAKYRDILANWTPQMPVPAPALLAPITPDAGTLAILPAAPLKSIIAAIDPSEEFIPLKAVPDIKWLPWTPFNGACKSSFRFDQQMSTADPTPAGLADSYFPRWVLWPGMTYTWRPWDVAPAFSDNVIPYDPASSAVEQQVDRYMLSIVSATPYFPDLDQLVNDAKTAIRQAGPRLGLTSVRCIDRIAGTRRWGVSPGTGGKARWEAILVIPVRFELPSGGLLT